MHEARRHQSELPERSFSLTVACTRSICSGKYRGRRGKGQKNGDTNMMQRTPLKRSDASNINDWLSCSCSCCCISVHAQRVGVHQRSHDVCLRLVWRLSEQRLVELLRQVSVKVWVWGQLREWHHGLGEIWERKGGGDWMWAVCSNKVLLKYQGVSIFTETQHWFDITKINHFASRFNMTTWLEFSCTRFYCRRVGSSSTKKISSSCWLTFREQWMSCALRLFVRWSPSIKRRRCVVCPPAGQERLQWQSSNIDAFLLRSSAAVGAVQQLVTDLTEAFDQCETGLSHVEKINLVEEEHLRIDRQQVSPAGNLLRQNRRSWMALSKNAERRCLTQRFITNFFCWLIGCLCMYVCMSQVSAYLCGFVVCPRAFAHVCIRLTHMYMQCHKYACCMCLQGPVEFADRLTSIIIRQGEALAQAVSLVQSQVESLLDIAKEQTAAILESPRRAHVSPRQPQASPSKQTGPGKSFPRSTTVEERPPSATTEQPTSLTLAAMQTVIDYFRFCVENAVVRCTQEALRTVAKAMHPSEPFLSMELCLTMPELEVKPTLHVAQRAIESVFTQILAIPHRCRWFDATMKITQDVLLTELFLESCLPVKKETDDTSAEASHRMRRKVKDVHDLASAFEDGEFPQNGRPIIACFCKFRQSSSSEI